MREFWDLLSHFQSLCRPAKTPSRGLCKVKRSNLAGASDHTVHNLQDIAQLHNDLK